ncbi:replication-relaxation family protein [Enterococcus hirae]|uniref:replication-relaxation family protein n=1 Tax=Enterococcus hirae TaxID=1354 RepID=UPI001378716F|nr:replication-relaxation family protein [Enterococcus hirae]NBA54938.1 hypothetical protein [Enterococcus hirae]
MNYLLHGYFIDYSASNKNTLAILCLLHELRVVTRTQLYKLLNFDSLISKQGVTNILVSLYKKNLIERKRYGTEMYYYLTKEGHQSIGGYYTLPKVPEYNLNHHLQINNYLIKGIELAKDHPHLKRIISERRTVYETKDLNPKTKGRKFFVPDFIFRFRDKENHEINWSFEIELTLKTRRRYREAIFPKYIRELRSRPESHLIYVTPSGAIQEELHAFKRIFFNRETEKDASQQELFERLHIFSAFEFEEGLKKLLTNDPAVNWRTVEREKIYPNGAVQSRLNLFEESIGNEEKPKVKFTPEVL